MKNFGNEEVFADVNPFLGLKRLLPQYSEKTNSNILNKSGKSPAKNSSRPEGESRAPLEAEVINEVELFAEAMAGVTPLKGGGREVTPNTSEKIRRIARPVSMEDFWESTLDFAEIHKGEYMEGHVVGIDKAVMQKLRCGAYSPEAHLDLHGLNTGQAFLALREFFRQSWHKGVRMVLVVTGRGLNSPQGVSILRDKMHVWLTQEPLKRLVLAFCTARPSDGGPGSIYILLRKYKRKGKIYWDRLPPDADTF